MSYAAELARATARRDEESRTVRLTGRARRLLGLAGWDATAEQLRTAAAGMSTIDQYKPADLELAIARALEIQHDETMRGRRLRPEEIQMATAPAEPKARRNIDAATREKIRDYVFHRRRKEPELTIGLALTDVNELYGADISYANFRATYWKPRESSGNGAKPYVHANGTNPTPPAAPKSRKAKRARKTKRTPPVAVEPAAAVAPTPAKPEAAASPESPAATAPASTAAPASTPEATTEKSGAVLPCFSLTPAAGRVRVQLDVTVDVESSGLLAAAIGQTLMAIARKTAIPTTPLGGNHR